MYVNKVTGRDCSLSQNLDLNIFEKSSPEVEHDWAYSTSQTSIGFGFFMSPTVM